MDQGATWYRGRLQPRRHCVRWGPSSPLPWKGAQQPPPLFAPYLLWPNGRMDQDTTWYRGSLGPGNIVLDGDPAPRTEREPAASPLFGPLCSGTVAHLSNCWALVLWPYCLVIKERYSMWIVVKLTASHFVLLLRLYCFIGSGICDTYRLRHPFHHESVSGWRKDGYVASFPSWHHYMRKGFWPVICLFHLFPKIVFWATQSKSRKRRPV